MVHNTMSKTPETEILSDWKQDGNLIYRTKATGRLLKDRQLEMVNETTITINISNNNRAERSQRLAAHIMDLLNKNPLP